MQTEDLLFFCAIFSSLTGFMDKYALSNNLVVTKIEELGDIGMPFPYLNVIIVMIIGLVFYSAIGMFIFTKRDTI